MGKFTYKTQGVCSQFINFEIGEDKKIHNLEFFGGCSGNLKAMGILLEGMDAKEAADKLRGNDCGGRGTSCGDQLSHALEEALAQQA